MNLPFPLALVLAAVLGFIALAYEILWTRLCSFASGSRAQAFGAMLGFYLLGLALGSLWSRRWQRGGQGRARWLVLARLMAISNATAFLVVPLASWLILLGSWVRMVPVVLVGATLLGTLLPLLCHLAIPPDERAGARMSYIYLANIIGSGAGSLLTGFVLMDCLQLWQIATILLLCGLGLAVALAAFSTCIRMADWAVWAGVSLLVASSAWLHSGLWERLQNEERAGPTPFAQVVESRHGVITVTSNRVVYGSGVYDGVIETQLRPGQALIRPYFLSALHPNPRHVLVIGMSAGAWTQILAHHPQVEKVTVVEISEAYLKVVQTWPQVSSVLSNPKVEIIIDDGRRWLRRNPDRRFDAIVMNTSFYWREFTSALLSQEFLEMAKAHLQPGGLVMWNCTGSRRALRTGMAVFPHTIMVMNNCVGSLSPLRPDEARWRSVLQEYRIDGQPVFNRATVQGRQDFEEIISFIRQSRPHGGHWRLVERQEMEEMCARAQIITDDNLGHEYQASLRTFLASLIPGLNWLFARIF
jgi:spermidine synthase